MATGTKVDMSLRADKGSAPMKRLTIDVPIDLHARIKSQCALNNVNMADEIRKLLQKHFPKKN